ncbi:hypothetical protein Dsin_017180 [Dipteronia sinensis]|uniref:HTH La-type RNA-binding domain-containing protein n=1 Tax=Dipteronia sinensis TaxID=43782 RepID=A0AAE0AEU6_9ROSI|nr:hypothetical protein Dsin_017180 [Dipteronia sinensis]
MHTCVRRWIIKAGLPIKLIAGFNKVKLLTGNIPLVSDALQNSTVVEIQGDKIRRRDDWVRWIMPPHINYSQAPVWD